MARGRPAWRPMSSARRPHATATLPTMPTAPLPYKIACLCDLRDQDGRVLLLHRERPPNQGLFSPIGGKLEMARGESPAQCARREIHEEAGLDIPIERLHLAGLISEAAYEGRGHWLIFLYRVIGPVRVEPQRIREGTLGWCGLDQIDALLLPDTDRRIIWPLIRAHERISGGDGRPGFFAVHIDCTGPQMSWAVEQQDGERR